MKKIILGAFLLGALMPQLSYAEYKSVFQCTAGSPDGDKDPFVKGDKNNCSSNGGVKDQQECRDGKKIPIGNYTGKECAGHGGVKGEALVCKDGTSAPSRTDVDNGFCQKGHGGMADGLWVTCKNGTNVDNPSVCSQYGGLQQ